MFYNLDLLKKRGGQFGVIWVAATQGTKLSRRQVSRVSLLKSCDDIMDYILVRIQPTHPGQSRTRFSLYLSAQLMCGVVKIYSKHIDYLLSDAFTFMSRLHLASVATIDIDLKETVSHDMVTLPDPVDLAIAEEPFFELDEITDSSKENLVNRARESIAVQEKLRAQSSSGSELMSSPRSSITFIKHEDIIGSPNTVRNIDDITLKESYSLNVPEPLPTIEEDLLLGFGDLHEQLMQCQQTEAGKSPVHLITDFAVVPVQETPIYRTEDHPSKIRKEPHSPGVTPEPQEKRRKRKRSSVRLILDDIHPDAQQEVKPPKKKKRKLIIDKEIRITRQAFIRNLNNCKTSLPNTINDLRKKNLEDIFATPGREFSSTLLPLYRRNCRLPGKDTLIEPGFTCLSPSTSQDVNILHGQVPSSPSVQISPNLSILRSPQRSTSMDRVRVLDNSSIIEQTISSTSLELSNKNTDYLLPEIESRTTLREISAVIEEEENVPPMPVDMAVLETSKSSKSNKSIQSFARKLKMAVKGKGWTTFRKLVPITTSRQTATKYFSQLLELCAKGKICVTQEKPYADIYIRRG